jgi:cobalt-precorrin-7 (C5)-methyltransferase
VNVVPGISSIQACAARLKICWDEAGLISFHEGVDAQKKKKLAESSKEGKILIILPDPKVFPPSDIARFLISEGVDEETPVFICENLTLDEERIFSSSLKELTSLNFSSLCIMVVKPL